LLLLGSGVLALMATLFFVTAMLMRRDHKLRWFVQVTPFVVLVSYVAFNHFVANAN
jgi:hypothetical protein